MDIQPYNQRRRRYTEAATLTAAGLLDLGDEPVMVRGVGLMARDTSAAGRPYVPLWLHPVRGGAYSLVGSIVAGALSDPQVGAIDLTGFADDKSVRINGTLIAATGADIDLLGADFEANINAEAAVNTLVTAAYDAATNRVRVTSNGPAFTLEEEDDTGGEMVVTEHLNRVAAMTATAAAGEWAVVTANGGTVVDAAGTVTLLGDLAATDTLASLALQLGTLTADKRLVLIAEWGGLDVGGNVTAATQALGNSLYLDDNRVGAAEQIGYCTNIEAGPTASWVNWSTGGESSPGVYGVRSAAIRPYLISFAPRNAGTQAQACHWAQTLDDGVIQSVALTGKTGSAPGDDQLVFVAASALVGVTGPQVGIKHAAVYLEV